MDYTIVSMSEGDIQTLFSVDGTNYHLFIDLLSSQYSLAIDH
jgi:hypothetical protein